MKKLFRLAFVILFTALITSLGVVVISADSEIDTKTYAVKGEGYDDWSSAVSAANGKETIYLNKDVSISKYIEISSKVKLNLNGHTLSSTQTTSTSFMFSLTSGADFTIEGEGSIKNVPVLVKAAASTKLSIKGLGDGITVDMRSGANKVFTLLPGSETYITGKITAIPTGIGGNFFYIGTNKNKVATAKLVFDGADFTVTEPSGDAQRKNSGNAINFLSAEDASNIVIRDSFINVVHGDFIELTSTSASVLTAGGKDGISATSYKGAIAAPTVLINIDGSKIIAGVSTYTRAIHSNQYYGAGILFTIGDKAAEIRVDNTTLVGTNRTISGKSIRNNANTTSAFLYFTNVDYISCDYSLYDSCWLVAEKVNLIWNGGKISFKNASRTNKGSISSLNDEGTASIDPLGMEAASALGLSSIPDNYVYYHNTSTKTYTYYTYTMVEGDTIACGGVGYSEMKKVTDSDGNITGYTKISDGETPDARFGLLFKNVYFEYAPASSATSPSGTSVVYSTAGNKYTNVLIKDKYWSNATVYATAFLDAPHTEQVFDVITAYTSPYNPTTSYIASSLSGTENFGSDTEASIIKTNQDFGVHENVISENGKNGYFKFYVSHGEDNGQESNPYFEMKIGTGKNSYLSYYDTSTNKEINNATESAFDDFSVIADNAGLSLEDYKFIVHEFDVATDKASYVEISPSLITGYANLTYSESKYKISSSAQAQGDFYAPAISESGALSFSASTSGITVDKGNTINIPTDGAWTRFSYVYEVCGWGPVSEYDLGHQTRTRATMKLNMHVYVNGDWAASFNNVLAAAVDTELSETLYLDSMRFNANCNAGSILIDNNRVSYYDANDVEATATLSALMNDVKSNVNNLDVFNFFPNNNLYYDPFAFVDGKICQTENELISSIKNGSFVELRKPLTTEGIELDKNVVFKTNGISMPKIISSTHKLVNQSSDIYNLVLADESEIYELNYVSDKFGIDETYGNAAFGTTVSPMLEINDSVAEGDDTIYIVGWTLIDGEESLAVSSALVSDGKLRLYPICKSAVTVVWVDNDGVEIARKNYKPGQGAFSEEFIATGIENINTGNGWYNLVYDSHKPISLKESGIFTVYPHMKATPIADGDPKVKDILINLSLYTDYTLNIYIPTYALPEMIDSITISKNKDGTNPLSSKDVTVKGQLYTMFSDNYGVADTTINNYYIIYEVDGTILTKTIDYGIPYYAYTVMNDAEQEMVTEKAKRLVMNMIDYALSVIDYCGSSADVSIYRELMDNEEYASYVVSYDSDSLYLEGGAIYESEIKGLTYKASAVDDPSTENIDESKLETERMKYASYWIKGTSFYFSTDKPTFIIEYSEKAESEFNGIKKPAADGTYGYWDNKGIFLYVGVDSTNEKIGPGLHVAYKGTIYNGEKILPNRDWDSLQFGDKNSYYAIAVATTSTSNYCKYSIYNMAETLKIELLNNDGVSDGTNDSENSIINDTFPGNGVTATYSLSAYIMEMLMLEKEQLALVAACDDTELKLQYAALAGEYRLAVNTAMSLYSYAKAARDYMGIEALPNYQ